MKKTVLIFLMAMPFMLFAQSNYTPLKTVNSQGATALKGENLATDLGSTATGETTETKEENAKAKKAKNYRYVNLGTTYYDLQTNASPGRRIVLHADGTISAVWTTSASASAPSYPNRGAGYNYFNGTDWNAANGDRVEANTRSGWPSIMDLGDGREAILAHESNTGGFVYSTNDSKGSRTFSSQSILDDVSVSGENRVPIWNRSAASNGKIHIISNYWVSEASNVPLVTRAGVFSPTTYSRWNIAGDTAEVSHILLPGYDSTLYAGGGGDNYAIDVRDSIVAVLIGGLGDPISLWKSTNNGETWTYTDVDQLPYKGANVGVELFLNDDTMVVNDGTVDVMIDANGKVHTFWGSTILFGAISETTGDTGATFRLDGTSLVYWGEGDAEPQSIGGFIDMNNNGELDINQATFAALDENDNLPSNLNSAARITNTMLVTMPSGSYDANGNLFVVYSSPIETATHYLDANFRDIHIMYSTDGGVTWSDPQNITQEGTEQCNFPCAAKMADDFVHVLWQQDATPGTHVTNNAPSNLTHENSINYINYAAIPVTDIINDVIGTNVSLGVDDIERTSEIFVVSQNQPNPFNGTSDVIVYLRNSSEVSLTVTDILGNVVNQGNLGTLGAGNHTVTIDANGLTSGMYFYTLSTNFNSVTKKMQVK